MKKYFTFLVTVFMFLEHSISAQVIVEQNYTSPLTKKKFRTVFDNTNYTKHSQTENTIVYSKDNKTYPKDNGEQINLNIVFQYNPNLYTPRYVIILNKDGYVNDENFWMGENPVSISVPPGNYDVIAVSSAYRNDNPDGMAYVIKEQIEIESDTTIPIDLSEADNHIVTQLYDENGELLKPGISEEGIGGNSVILASNSIIFNPLDALITGFNGGFEYYFDDEGLPNDFYISDVSDRYSFLQSRIAIKYDGGFYLSKYPIISNISNSMMVQNIPDEYVLQKEKFQISPLGESGEGNYPGFNASELWKGALIGGWSGYDKSVELDSDNEVKLFINNPISGSPQPHGYDLLIHPAFVDLLQIIEDPDWGSYEKAYMTIPAPVLINDENIVHSINAGSIQSNISFAGSENGKFLFLPSHPKFSYTSADNPNIIQGDNTPITSIIARNFYADWLQGKYSDIQLLFKGRYGETKMADYNNTSIEISYNNQNIFSGTYYDIENFMSEWSEDQHPEGVLDITFINQNSRVDNLQGKNITHINYDWTKEDWTAPTLQMLQFRNSEGKVMHKFTSASEGTVRLSAGDFKFTEVDEWGNGYFEYNPGNIVNFYYTKHDQNNWVELPLTNYLEYFQMPAFGDYYEASLADVLVPEENTWFDVKIICTDAAGNKQEQIISPAFKIAEKTLAVADANKSDLSVYPNPFTDQLNIQFPENMKGNVIFRVTDMAGKTIYTQTQQSEKAFVFNGASLPKGVYIVTVENEGKVVAKKVVKK